MRHWSLIPRWPIQDQLKGVQGSIFQTIRENDCESDQDIVKQEDQEPLVSIKNTLNSF